MLKTLSSLSFSVIDKRGQAGFPADKRGLIYLHEEERQLPHRYVDLGEKNPVQCRKWAVRHSPEGWRVDKYSGFGMWEADPKVQDHFKSHTLAAKALSRRLTSQKHYEG